MEHNINNIHNYKISITIKIKINEKLSIKTKHWSLTL